KGEFDFSREIIGIPNFEKNQIVIAKIILNALGLRGNHRFRQREVFEDARWRIYFSENVMVVRNYPEVTIFNSLNNRSEIPDAEIINNAVEPALLGRLHHFLEEVCSLTTNTQSD